MRTKHAKSPLLALADAMVINLQFVTYTFYLILLRETTSTKAVITEPYVKKGQEVAGGWNIGKEENGGAYFNKFMIVNLTPEQEALVTQIAKNTYRPCCNNSTFYQDCNHGSALLGLLQLGASQGLTEEELYKEALAFNSFWFPQNYIQTALYFKVAKNTDWDKVDPKIALGFDYSTGSGWSKNVQTEIAKIPDLLPQVKGGGGCRGENTD